MVRGKNVKGRRLGRKENEVKRDLHLEKGERGRKR